MRQLTVTLCSALLFCGAAGALDIPRAEHPRPDMERAQWLNLNGEWEFAETDDNAVDLSVADAKFPDKITVPFCRESALSGLGRKGFVNNVWYRRSVETPADWAGKRVLLHLGACDWKTTVWVNGTVVGAHTGGSAPVTCDITAALVPGANTVVVHAFDDVRSGAQAGGKQSPKPESFGCMYTRTTGIWQTVWMEAVGQAYVETLRLTPDPGNKRLRVLAGVKDAFPGMRLRAAASLDGREAGKADVVVTGGQAAFDLALSPVKLWEPGKPVLYDLTLTLARDGEAMDAVKSYFGMRTVSVQGRAILINGKAVFQRTVLDQGFYPDGIWTAPTEEALKHDIELSMEAGFNGARLHQKVFEPRFLYWADKLGYLVWGEFPNWGLDYKNPAVDNPVVNEWREIVGRDFNHPAIIGWCPFNETPPDAAPLQNTIVNLTIALDPTRPVIDSSGWHHGHPDPMVLDAHDYDQNPESFKARWDAQCGPLGGIPGRYTGGADKAVPFFVSEYGGIGWTDDPNGWGYGNNPKSLDEFYARYEGLTAALLGNRFMFGFCYTQLTNVEQEQNGVYTFDRKPKFDTARIRAVNQRAAAYENNPPLEPAAEVSAWKVLVGANGDEGAAPWKYAKQAPVDGWEKPGFDDAKWKEGRGGFGEKEGWNKRIRTPWRDKDILLRQSFTFDGADFAQAQLVIHYDNAAEVYLNGVEIWRGEGWSDTYRGMDVTEKVKQALKPGENLLAAHCHQDDGGQFIDMALLTAARPAGAAAAKTEPKKEPAVEKTPYGKMPDGREVSLYTLTNGKGMVMRVTDYGAIITELWVPDKNGAAADVALGYDNLDKYMEATPYFGSVIGRVGNRIARGKFTLDGKQYTLAVNNDLNHLHGGLTGFDKVLWNSEPAKRDGAVGVKFAYRSVDGEEGYPGNLDCVVTYWLTEKNELELEYSAKTDKATPINLTNHCYFNLRGHNGGDILGHEMMLNASRFTPVDETLIPTGELRPVKGTPMDFTTPAPIGARVNAADEQIKFGLGYDHNWVLDKEKPGEMSLCARVREPESGRVMEVWTTEPGVQFYCGNFLDGTNIGKGNAVYHHRNGFCLETQHFPDSINKQGREGWPSAVLKPGETYRHHTIYRFSAE